MTSDQEKYLIKRLEEISRDKYNEITQEKYEKLYDTFGYDRHEKIYSDIYLLKRYLIKTDKSKLKLKIKLTPKNVFEIIKNSGYFTYDFISKILDLSEFEKLRDEINDEMANRYDKLNETMNKLKRDIILKNDCNEIVKMIKEFEETKI